MRNLNRFLLLLFVLWSAAALAAGPIEEYNLKRAGALKQEYQTFQKAWFLWLQDMGPRPIENFSQVDWPFQASLKFFEGLGPEWHWLISHASKKNLYLSSPIPRDASAESEAFIEYENNRIQVSSSFGPQFLWSFIHEILHSMDEQIEKSKLKFNDMATITKIINFGEGPLDLSEKDLNPIRSWVFAALDLGLFSEARVYYLQSLLYEKFKGEIWIPKTMPIPEEFRKSLSGVYTFLNEPGRFIPPKNPFYQKRPWLLELIQKVRTDVQAHPEKIQWGRSHRQLLERLENH